jgi:hypothetical protein
LDRSVAVMRAIGDIWLRSKAARRDANIGAVCTMPGHLLRVSDDPG